MSSSQVSLSTEVSITIKSEELENGDFAENCLLAQAKNIYDSMRFLACVGAVRSIIKRVEPSTINSIPIKTATKTKVFLK